MPIRVMRRSSTVPRTPTTALSPISATVVAGSAGYLTLFPADHPLPSTSTLNFQAGQVRATNAVLRLSSDGHLAAQAALAGGSVHLILDVNGYFAAADPVDGQ